MAEDSIHDETSPPLKALFWIVWDYTSMFRDDPWSVSFIELTSMIVSFIKLTSGPHARAHTDKRAPVAHRGYPIESASMRAGKPHCRHTCQVHDTNLEDDGGSCERSRRRSSGISSEHGEAGETAGTQGSLE